MRRLLSRVSALVIVFASCGIVPQTTGQVTDVTAHNPSGFVAANATWRYFKIPVCWLNASEQNGIIRQRILEVLGETISAVSRYSFDDRGSCGTIRGSIIKVLFADQRPNSLVGDYTRYTTLPAKGQSMILNDKFTCFDPLKGVDCTQPNLKSTGSSESCASPASYRSCLAYTVVHEFLHALGFLHEQLRPEFADPSQEHSWCVTNPEIISERYNEISDINEHWKLAYDPTKVGPYDHSSIMNYCNEENYRTFLLSSGDLATLKYLEQCTSNAGECK